MENQISDIREKKKIQNMFNSKTPERIANDGNFDTPDINNLKKEKKISRKDLANLSKGAKKKRRNIIKFPQYS